MGIRRKLAMNALSLLLLVGVCSCNALILAPAVGTSPALARTSSIEMFTSRASPKKTAAKKVAKKPVKKVAAKKPVKKVAAKKPVKKVAPKKPVKKAVTPSEPSFLKDLFSLSLVGGAQEGVFFK